MVDGGQTECGTPDVELHECKSEFGCRVRAMLELQTRVYAMKMHVLRYNSSLQQDARRMMQLRKESAKTPMVSTVSLTSYYRICSKVAKHQTAKTTRLRITLSHGPSHGVLHGI